MVADLVVASEALKHDPAPYAKTLVAAYGAIAAGYTAASAAADQADVQAPFPLLPLQTRNPYPSPYDVLSLAQVADYLQVSEAAIRVEIDSGRIAGQLIGGEWRFLRENVIQWLRTPRHTAPKSCQNAPVSEETPEEYEAFMANIRAHRDEVDRALGYGKYAPE